MDGRGTVAQRSITLCGLIKVSGREALGEKKKVTLFFATALYVLRTPSPGAAKGISARINCGGGKSIWTSSNNHMRGDNMPHHHHHHRGFASQSEAQLPRL